MRNKKSKRLGRDLNPGHGSDSPICLACLKANPTSIRPLHYQGMLNILICVSFKAFCGRQRGEMAAIWAFRPKPVPPRPLESLTSVFEMGTGKPLHFGRQVYIERIIYKVD